jgi:hypothetical protein
MRSTSELDFPPTECMNFNISCRQAQQKAIQNNGNRDNGKSKNQLLPMLTDRGFMLRGTGDGQNVTFAGNFISIDLVCRDKIFHFASSRSITPAGGIKSRSDSLSVNCKECVVRLRSRRENGRRDDKMETKSQL